MNVSGGGANNMHALSWGGGGGVDTNGKDPILRILFLSFSSELPHLNSAADTCE